MIIERMKIEHVEQVGAIEKMVYPSPWSKGAFISEIDENSFASYYVALDDCQVIGYGGIWIILDEAHITNLAVHPRYQRLQVGTALLQQLIYEALAHGVRRMTLEVRFSNKIAQNLYCKFGFMPRGVRTKYYSDEDAMIMWLDDLELIKTQLEQVRTQQISQRRK
ncbi:MAG: ribosomal protein S18-alanine N-acetyltransferase [Dethiobacter sp.]|jgi:ribosomal-protein-alanine N-acetyltransferase|nr:ribosomal protein S18-alanine N-acetyltransferase [Dethiobacter sp.]